MVSCAFIVISISKSCGLHIDITEARNAPRCMNEDNQAGHTYCFLDFLQLCLRIIFCILLTKLDKW